MRKSWIHIVTLLLAACSELKVSTHAGLDGGNLPPEDASMNLDEGVEAGLADAGAEASILDAGKDAQVCDGPCPATLLATGLLGANRVIVAQGILYFATENDSTVWSCPTSGCGSAPRRMGPGVPFGIAALGSYIYWGDFPSGKIWSCPTAGCGGNPTAIAVNQSAIRGVVTDGNSLFWSANNDIVTCTPGASNTCTPRSIRTGVGPIYAMAADQNMVAYIANSQVYACPSAACTSPILLGNGNSGLTLFAGTAYWISGASVVSCAVLGCSANPKPLALSNAPIAPVVDTQALYYRDGNTFEIIQCPTSGCTPTSTVFAKNEGVHPGANLAMDATYLYWATPSLLRRKAR